jgi:hypothetical protein
MDFQVLALDAEKFQELYGLDDSALANLGVERHTVLEKPGYPCRVSLADCEIGESVLLLNYEHQPANTPYRSSHAIFVRDGAETAVVEKNVVPEVLRIRMLSVRSFDSKGNMLDAEVIQGDNLPEVAKKMLANDEAAYLHAHNAGRGCFAATIVRV